MEEKADIKTYGLNKQILAVHWTFTKISYLKEQIKNYVSEVIDNDDI